MFGLKYLYSLVLPVDKERPEIIQEGRRSKWGKWGSRRALGSPSLTSEPQLHIERLSLKSTWDQQSSYSPSQAIKKTHAELRREGGREKQSAQNRPSLLGGHRGGGDIMGEGILPGERGLWAMCQAPQPLVWHGEDEPAWLAWTPVGFPKGCKRLRLHS